MLRARSLARRVSLIRTSTSTSTRGSVSEFPRPNPCPRLTARFSTAAATPYIDYPPSPFTTNSNSESKTASPTRTDTATNHALSMVQRQAKSSKQQRGAAASKRARKAQKRLLASLSREQEQQEAEEESLIPVEVRERAAWPGFGHSELMQMAEEQREERRRVLEGFSCREREREEVPVEEGYDAGFGRSEGLGLGDGRDQGYGEQRLYQEGGFQEQGFQEQGFQDMGMGSSGFGQDVPFPFMPMPMPPMDMQMDMPLPMSMPPMPMDMPMLSPITPGYWFNPPMFQHFPQPPPFGQFPFPPFENPLLQSSQHSIRSRGPVSISIRHKSTSPRRRPGPPAPKLSKEYLAQASLPPTLTPTAQPLLIILDLNGTLILRTRRQLPAVFARRPGLDAFLSYLFSNFKTMIWTSSQPETVADVVRQLLPHGERKQLVDIWARDTLGLTKAQYREKVQVYKPLKKVWKSKTIQSAYPQPADKPPTEKNTRWNQTNTVLIDDSALKAIANPHNIIQIPEFTNDPSVDERKNLYTVMRQLRILSYYSDVSQKLHEWAQTLKQGAATVSPEAVDEFWDAKLREEEEKLEAVLGRKLDTLETETLGVDDVDETSRELDRDLHISGLNPAQGYQHQQQMQQTQLAGSRAPKKRKPRRKGMKAKAKANANANANER